MSGRKSKGSRFVKWLYNTMIGLQASVELHFIDVSGRGFSSLSIGGAILLPDAGGSTLVTIGADTVLLHSSAFGTVTAADSQF